MHTLLAEIRRLTPVGVPNQWLTGHLDGLRHGQLHGWLYSPRYPALHLSVAISCDGQLWQTVIADRPRLDVKNAGHGDGQYGFTVTLPIDWTPGSIISVHLADTAWLLGRVTLPITADQALPPRPMTPPPIQIDNAPPANTPVFIPYTAGIHEQEILRYFAQRPASIAQENVFDTTTPAWDKPVVIIAFTNRSGSNLLAEALAATGLINCAQELFNCTTVINTCDRQQLATFNDYLATLQQVTPAEQPFAIKLGWNQLYFLTRIGVIPRLWPDVRIVWMVRADVPAQALSLLVAQHTQCWKQDYPATILNQYLATLQPHDLIAPMSDITLAQRQFWLWCAVYGIEPAIVEYTELASDPESTAQRVCRELQLIPDGWQWQFDASAIRVTQQRTIEMEQCLMRLRQQLHFPRHSV